MLGARARRPAEVGKPRLDLVGEKVDLAAEPVARARSSTARSMIRAATTDRPIRQSQREQAEQDVQSDCKTHRAVRRRVQVRMMVSAANSIPRFPSGRSRKR